MAAFTKSGTRKASDRQIDPTDTASFALGNAAGILSRIAHELKPSMPLGARGFRGALIQARESCGRTLRHGTSITRRLFRFRFDPTRIALVSSMTC